MTPTDTPTWTPTLTPTYTPTPTPTATATPCLDLDMDGLCDGIDPDIDGDGCPNINELQTAIGSEVTGGRRNPYNPWDYWNPTHDGKNRGDDILTIVAHYNKNIGNPAYSTDYDRSYLGPNPWNLGPPDGHINSIDILAIVKQYNHDCA